MYWHVFPTYGEAKDAVWRDPNMLFSTIPPEIVEKTNESELVVKFKNGSLIQLKGADDPDALRGPNPYGVILDEFAKMKYAVWGEVIQPILRANGGWCWFVGTPKGKNHFFKLYEAGLQGHKEWGSWLLKASKSGIVAEDQLREARDPLTGMSEALYNQEFECEFLEGEGQVFRGVKYVCTASPKEPEERKNYVMGIDLAKYQDFTVLAVYDIATNEQVYQDRFQTLEWPFQMKKIGAVARHYNNAICVVDATGLGDPVTDVLIREGLIVEAIKITEPMKKELVEKLSIFIEQKQLKMINMEETMREFDNFSYQMSTTGRIHYGAPEGEHDDIVIAHALAVRLLQPLRRYPLVPFKTPIQREYEYQKKSQYEHGHDDIGGDAEW